MSSSLFITLSVRVVSVWMCGVVYLVSGRAVLICLHNCARHFSPPSLLPLVELQIAFAPLIGLESIQYSKGEDWEGRRRCLYPVFKGETLESYFPHFVHIAQVSR